MEHATFLILIFVSIFNFYSTENMNLLAIICLLLLSCSSNFAKNSRPIHHKTSHSRHRPIAQYTLSKLQSVSSWLNSKQDSTAFDYIFRINKGLGLNLYQGDIKGHSAKQTRVAVKNTERLWNSRTIPYTFDDTLSQFARRMILSGMKEIQNKTCIRFVPRTTEKDYINFNQNEGCSSEVGRKGDKQDISLMSNCLIQGTVIHEIMHALGFFHEQSRPDRDSWVQIVYDNIQAGKEFNFIKESANDVTTLGLQYDYESVMHYSKYAFTKNGGPTILPIVYTTAQLGQRAGMSNLDVQKLNKLYQCDKSLPLIPTVPQKVPTKFIFLPTKAPTKTATSLPGRVTHMPIPPKLIIPQLQAKSTPVPSIWTSWSTWSSCDLNCNRKRYRFCMSNNPNMCVGAATQTSMCDNTCKPVYPLGCWKDTYNNLAIPAAYVISTKVDSKEQAMSVIQQCGNYAAQSGYSVFAIFNEGICLTGPLASTSYMKHGPSAACGPNGLGGHFASSVYSLRKDIDGNWSAWSQWGQCSRTCGGGQQFRYRHCNNPAPFGSGAQCQGSDREYQTCNSMQCKDEEKCGTKFHTGVPGTSGIISLQNYSNFMECEYEIITGDPTATISLAITRLDIEHGANCIYDALMVFDGADAMSHLIGAYCGNAPPGPIQSTSNKLFLKFESDETRTKGGFELLYTINNKTRKSCVTPQPVAHAKMIHSTNFVGDRVFYQCDDNYNLIGPSSITCTDQPALAVWSDSFPYCMRHVKRSIRKQLHSKLCTFEDNLCGFTQDDNDDLDWQLLKATQTDDVPQLPLDDKTKGIPGKYFAAKATRLSNVGDIAKVYTPLVYQSGPSCLKFWYQTSGPEDGTQLNVYINQGNNDSEDLLFESDTDTSYIWKEANISVLAEDVFQIVFEHVVGERYDSFSAIDDVIITSGACKISA